MKLLFFIFLYSLLSTQFAFANDSVLCKEEKTERKVHMKQVSDHVGFCGPFAFRALLNESLCLSNPEKCELPSIAQIVGLLRYDKEIKKIGSKKFYQNFLDEFHEKGFYSESCLPFEGLFPADQRPEQGVNWSGNFQFFYKRFINSYLQDSYDLEKNCFNKNYFSSNPVSPDELGSLRIGADLLQFFYQDVNEKKSRENKCKSHKFSKIKVKTTKLDENAAQTLKEKLKDGPIMVGLKIRQNNTEEEGPHAVVLTNFNEVCCFGTCDTRYEVLDSLRHYWAPSHDKGWISEEDLLKALDPSLGTQLEVLD